MIRPGVSLALVIYPAEGLDQNKMNVQLTSAKAAREAGSGESVASIYLCRKFAMQCRSKRTYPSCRFSLCTVKVSTDDFPRKKGQTPVTKNRIFSVPTSRWLPLHTMSCFANSRVLFEKTTLLHLFRTSLCGNAQEWFLPCSIETREPRLNKTSHLPWYPLVSTIRGALCLRGLDSSDPNEGRRVA